MKKLVTYFLSFILILVSFNLQAKQTNGDHSSVLDSLTNILESSKEDTNKVIILNALCFESKQVSPEKAIHFAEDALKLSQNLYFKNGEAKALFYIGLVYRYSYNFEKSLEYYLQSLKIQKEIGDKKEIINSLTRIADIYKIQRNWDKSMEFYISALKLSEEVLANSELTTNPEKQIENKKQVGRIYYLIGHLYKKQNDFDGSLKYFFRALKIYEGVKDEKNIADISMSLGIIFYDRSNNDKSQTFVYKGVHKEAMDYILKARKLYVKNNNNHGIIRADNHLAYISAGQGKFERALEYGFAGLKLSQETKNEDMTASLYGTIGDIYYAQENYQKALEYLEICYQGAKAVNNQHYIRDLYLSFASIYSKLNDYKKAFRFHKLYSEMKDTLLNRESSKQIREMSTKYESEKKDKELFKKDAEIAKQQMETEKQNLQRNGFITGFALVLFLAFFIFRGYRQKHNANHLLEGKNILIEKQKLLVEVKNIKITDSINYAKRIQQAILPSQELIKSFLPESFIFFRPKDIVSGDFYWFTKKQDKLIIAVADCTGHGVPGAFMSMIGNTLLNEIVNVKNIVEPDQILNQLNKGVVNLLHQRSTESSTQDDGMDITILAIDKTNNEIQFAGANHFSYLIDNQQLITLKGDVYSIGGMFGSEDINFSSQKIKIEKGTALYLFTDGFVDQFGGEKNTKFLSGRFEQLLQNVQQHGMEKQQEELVTAFDDWKGNNKQLDDVLVVGICF